MLGAAADELPAALVAAAAFALALAVCRYVVHAFLPDRFVTISLPPVPEMEMAVLPLPMYGGGGGGPETPGEDGAALAADGPLDTAALTVAEQIRCNLGVLVNRPGIKAIKALLMVQTGGR